MIDSTQAVASPLGGGLGDLLASSDAEAMLVSGILDHHLHMDAKSLRAAAFLQAYGCGDVLAVILEYRRYQNSMSALVRATEAISLKKFMGQVQIQLNNK